MVAMGGVKGGGGKNAVGIGKEERENSKGP